MGWVEVSAGEVEYGDTGGEGPVLVMLPGLGMDGRLWHGVIEALGDEYRCITPVLPFGAHERPMRADADLSLRGVGRIVTELLAALDLRDVVLCFNDWGGAQVMIADRGVERVGKLVLVSCETEGNYPPGLAGQAAWLSAKLPGGLALMRRTLLTPWLRRLPMVYDQMSKRGVPDELMRSWLEPLRRPEIKRDLRKYAGDAMNGRKAIRAASAALPSFERPVLVVWDREGKMMPAAEGRRLAAAFPNSRFLELDDCYTLVPLDQPRRLAELIADFAA
ncbi:MAG TPA: alpha/beta hydrolase [Solirubrobacterales bacterium]|nr:alpha/beta hydrolase [Solirubrobacterales bacterium]